MEKEIIDIADSIKYQENSVVSREVLKKEKGSITFFAFDKGQGLSEHISPFDAVVNIIDGRAEIKISGDVYNVGKGEMMIMPANKPHELKAVEQFKMMLIMIKS